MKTMKATSGHDVALKFEWGGKSMMTVKAEIVPKRKCEQLASPLLQLVRAAFENPQIQEEFEQWKKEREKARKMSKGEG